MTSRGHIPSQGQVTLPGQMTSRGQMTSQGHIEFTSYDITRAVYIIFTISEECNVSGEGRTQTLNRGHKP